MLKKIAFIGLPILLLVLLFSLRSYGAYLETHPKGFHINKYLNIKIDENKLFDLVQNWRQSKGLSTYTKSEKLCKFAEIRISQVLVDFSHDKFFSEYKNNDYFGYNVMGENLVRDYLNAENSLKAWINSPKHLENLEKPFVDSCIRCSGSTCVQIFGGY